LKWCFPKTETSIRVPKPRVAKPKSEKDCPRCREGGPLPPACTHALQPWCQKKGRVAGKRQSARRITSVPIPAANTIDVKIDHTSGRCKT
jgi:hypothetical protein